MQAAPSGERVSMYEDFVREKEKKEREAKKAERKKRMAAFRQVLDSTKSIKVGLAKHSVSGFGMTIGSLIELCQVSS